MYYNLISLSFAHLHYNISHLQLAFESITTQHNTSVPSQFRIHKSEFILAFSNSILIQIALYCIVSYSHFVSRFYTPVFFSLSLSLPYSLFFAIV